METRINEILNCMNSFTKELYTKQEVLPELFALQKELVNLTFNDTHTENSDLKIWDVEAHLDRINNECDHIADDLLSKFKDNCKVICNTIKAENSGQAGEYKAFKSLETLRCKNTVLKNIEFNKNDHRTEIDAIVITEKALFIVEVKNTSKNIYIDERGNYCRVSKSLIFDKNIGEKMNEKYFLLSQALKNCGIENINIQNIVVFTNSSINVENHFPYINICYLSNMPHFIAGYHGERIYNDDDIENIITAINTNKCHESYSMPIDMQEFKKDFATLMATLEKASKDKALSDAQGIDNTIKKTASTKGKTNNTNSTFDWFRKHRLTSQFAVSFAVATLTTVVAVKTILKR